MSEVERFLLEGLLVRVESNADDALSDEVHLHHLILLVVNNILIIILAKLAR